jgi:hypothetical protein
MVRCCLQKYLPGTKHKSNTKPNLKGTSNKGGGQSIAKDVEFQI